MKGASEESGRSDRGSHRCHRPGRKRLPGGHRHCSPGWDLGSARSCLAQLRSRDPARHHRRYRARSSALALVAAAASVAAAWGVVVAVAVAVVVAARVLAAAVAPALAEVAAAARALAAAVAAERGSSKAAAGNRRTCRAPLGRQGRLGCQGRSGRQAEELCPTHRSCPTNRPFPSRWLRTRRSSRTLRLVPATRIPCRAHAIGRSAIRSLRGRRARLLLIPRHRHPQTRLQERPLPEGESTTAVPDQWYRRRAECRRAPRRRHRR